MLKMSDYTSILENYQEFCPETFVYHTDHNRNLAHITNGLFAEAGEIAAAYQKFYRGDYEEIELHKRLIGEIGGLMYYLSMLCNIEGISLTSVLIDNKAKLLDRQRRGVIQGDGDER